MIPKEVTLHQHDMSNFLSCPRKYFLANVYNIESRYKPRAINIGGIFAKACYVLHLTNDVPLALQTIHESKLEMESVTTQEQQSKIDNDLCMLQAMLFGYYTHFIEKRKYPTTPIIDELLPEHKLQVPINLGGIKYNYVMRLDGKIVDSIKHNWILEIKTSAGVRDNLIKELPTNFQINSYWYGMNETYKNRTSGVLYRFVEKAGIRQKQKESLDQFRTRIMLEYDENPARYFIEESLFFDEPALEAFKKDLHAHFRYMTYCYIMNYFPKNGNSCTTKYGNHCEYLTYCSNQTEETLHTFYKTKDEYNEDATAGTSDNGHL